MFSGNTVHIQRPGLPQTSTVESTQYTTTNPTPSFDSPVKRDMRVFAKASSQNRPVVRHVVVGNRSKLANDLSSESSERNIGIQREDSSPFETRYYQTVPGQRELTVREKLQQDMARGFVQTTTQKKLYPVRMPTTMKRRISENQPQFADSFGNDPNQQRGESASKRSRPSQYMYQVRGPAPPTGQFQSTLQQQPVRAVQPNSSVSSNASINNSGEQQATSQTVPMIFHHGVFV